MKFVNENHEMIQVLPGQLHLFSASDEQIQESSVERLEADIRTLLAASAQCWWEVGRRLLVVKGKVNHGQWGQWLADNFELTQNTANAMMKLAVSANSEPVQNLGWSKALQIIRALPEPEDQEAFLEAEHDTPSGKKKGKDLSRREMTEALCDTKDNNCDGQVDDLSEDPQHTTTPAQQTEASPPKSVHFSSDSDIWGTPQALFDLLAEECAFDLDVCALPENAKCEDFFSPDDNGLEKDWGDNLCFMNPPYSEIDRWMAKAYAAAKDGATVYCLVPARTDTGWWWDYARRGEIRFLRGRLKFTTPDGQTKHAAPFPSALVIFHPGVPGSDTMCYHWEDWNP